MVSDLMVEFTIGGAMLGTLSALYFYLCAASDTAGYAVRNCGYAPVTVLCAQPGCSGLGVIWSGAADQLAYLGRIPIGIASSVGLGSLALAKRWFPERHLRSGGSGDVYRHDQRYGGTSSLGLLCG